MIGKHDSCDSSGSLARLVDRVFAQFTIYNTLNGFGTSTLLFLGFGDIVFVYLGHFQALILPRIGKIIGNDRQT